MSRFVNPTPQYLDGSGDPLISGKLFFFDSGTSTPKSTFADITETIPNPNPVILTGDGRAPNIFFTGSAKVKLTDSDDVQVYERDPVGGDVSEGQFSDFDTETIYGSGEIVIGSDANYYVSLSSGNQSNDPTTSPTFWLEIEFINIWNPNKSFDLNETAKASDGLLYRSLVANNLGNDPISSPTEWGSPIPAVDTDLVNDTSPQLGGFLDPNGNFIGRDKGADIASASPLVIGTDGDFFDVTGTVGFAVMTVAANRSFVLQFDDAVPITVASGITLNNAGNDYTTSSGDIIQCQSTATDTVTGWIIKADGTAVVPAVTDLVNDTTPQLGGALDTNSFSINESDGAAVASATTTDIFGAGDGNTVHITGTTTIVDFTDAPSAGRWQKIIFDDVLTLTDGSGITLQGSVNITTAASDIAWVYSDTVSAFTVLYFKADGSPVVSGGGTSVAFSGANEVFVPIGTANRTKIILSNFRHATGATTINIQVSTDGGSTGESGAGTYRYNFQRLSTVATNSAFDSTGGQNSTTFLGTDLNFSNNDVGPGAIEIDIYNAGLSNRSTQLICAGPAMNDGAGQAKFIDGIGHWNPLTVVNAIRIYTADTGNFSGDYVVEESN